MIVYIDGKRVDLKAKDQLGVGGEAQVFLMNGKAVKIFHPLDPKLSAAQKKQHQLFRRIKEKKLKQFPSGLPNNVIVPRNLALDRNGKLLGYEMNLVDGAEPLIMLSNKKFRRAFSNEDTVTVLRNTRHTLQGIHRAGVVVGDFNDLNVLFKGLQSYFIDADSMQFAGLPCVVATERFLDPSLFGQDFAGSPVFTTASDNYALAVMIFQSLLYVHPYGGIHKGYKTLLRRAESNISVFDKDVKYPKAAMPFGILPDDLLSYFQSVFDRGERTLVPEMLLGNLRFTTCSGCGAVHARAVCPICSIASAAIKEAITYHGSCKASRILKTLGYIVDATVQQGRLLYLLVEGESVKRENGELVLKEKPTQDMRFSFMGNSTVIGKGDQVVVVKNEKVHVKSNTQKLGNLPMFDSNIADYFTLSGDYLAGNDENLIGQILSGQTWFKVGPTFGLGFYRVGKTFVYFVFDVEKGGLDDAVELPQLAGKIIDAECIFNNDYALLTFSRVDQGKTYNSMYLVKRDGTVVSQFECEADNSRVLSNIRGKVLGGKNVLTATDDGLLLMVPENGQMVESKLFADTEPFVDENCELLMAKDGVYVVSEKEITHLRLS